MEKYTLRIQESPANIDEFISTYLGNVSSSIRHNPKFKRELEEALKILTEKRFNDKEIPAMELVIDIDGSSFEIISGIRRDPYVANPKLSENRMFNKVRFSASGINGMEITRWKGTFYQFDDFVNIDSEYKKKIYGLTSKSTPTVIDVSHAHKTYTKDGIEVEESRYSDYYFLSCDYHNDDALRRETIIHAPVKWNFDIMPESPRFENKPYVFKASRYLNSLGLVTVQTKSGRNGQIEGAHYPAGTEYPDQLTTGFTPYLTHSNGQTSITQFFERLFPGMRREAIETELMKTFYKGIDNSASVKRLGLSDLCNKMKEKTKFELVNRYHVDANELNEHKRGY